jgi:hypothetical protein
MKKKIMFLGKNINLIIKVLSMVMVLISVTFAWHYFGKEVWVNPFETDVQKVINIYITDDLLNGEWSDKLEIKDRMENSITEFSGNGDKLYVPVVENRQIKGYYKPDYSSGREKDFVEIKAYIKTNGSVKFYIDPSSSVNPVDTEDKKGDIAGAVRVAILMENYKPYVWAPNTTYEYNLNTNTVNRNGIPEDKYTYVYKDSDDEFVSTEDIVTIENPDHKVAGFGGDDNRFLFGDLYQIDKYYESVPPIFETVDTGEELIIPITIRLFVEGTDREAVSSLVGGKINLNLKFSSKIIE